MGDSLAEEGFYGSELFDFMQSIVDDDPSLKKRSMAKVNAVCVITLRNKDGKQKSWVMDFKNDGLVRKINSEKPPKTEIHLFLKDADFVKLINNEANPQRLFMSGRLKIKGNIVKAASIELFLRSVDPRTRAKL